METYRIILQKQAEHEGFIASAPELHECTVEAPTRREALEKLEALIAEKLATLEREGIDAPHPIDTRPVEGKLQLSLSSSLQRELHFAAREEQVPVDQLVTEMVTRALYERYSHGTPRSREPRDRHSRRENHRQQGARYHNIMENRENFIEYVRGLDHDGGRTSSRPRRPIKRGDSR